MPVVPTYDNLRTSVAPMPGPQAAPMDGPARQAAQFGDAVGRAGGALQSIIIDEQQRADQTRVADAMNQAVAARLRLTHDKADGYTQLVGRAALDRPDGKGLDEEYIGRLKGEIDAIDASLGNDQQRRVFRQQAGQMLAQFGADVAQYRNRQHTTYQVSVAAGTIETARNMASLEADDPAALAQARQAVQAGVYELGRLHGWSAQETAAKTVEQLSPMHASVISGWLEEGRTDQAKGYLEQVKAELTPAARDHLGKAVAVGGARVKAQSFADDAMGRGMTLSDAIKEARAKFQGKEEDEAVQEIKGRFADAEMARLQGARAVGQQAWTAVMSSGQIPASLLPTLRAQAPEEERQIRDWLDAKRRQAKAEAEGKGDSPEQFGKFYSYFRMALEEPGKFADLDLRKAQPYVSKAQLGHLVTLQGGINRGEAKASTEATVVRNTLGLIKAEVARAGIDMTPKEGTKQAEQTAQFMGALTQSLMQAQAAKGSPLSPDEAKRIGMDMLREGIEQGSGMFGLFQTTRRGYQIASDPAISPGASFVAKRFSDIPNAARNALVAEYRMRSGIGLRPLTSEQEAEIEREYTRRLRDGRIQ